MEEIRAGETTVKLPDGEFGLVTKGLPGGQWLIQVPGEELEREVEPKEMETAPAVAVFIAAKLAYADPWRIPRWASVGLAAGLRPADYLSAGFGENGWDCDCGARRISFEHHPVICPVCGADVRVREKDPVVRAVELETRRARVARVARPAV